MVKEIWKYLHKPRYVDVGQLDRHGRTAARVAAQEGHRARENVAVSHPMHRWASAATAMADIVDLLQGLGVDAEVDFANEVFVTPHAQII
jgi:hypothetical protein